MTYWKLLSATLACFAFLNFVVVPKMTSAWKANHSIAKISRVGMLGAAELLRDFSLLASVMYVCFGVLVELTLLVPANISLLAWVVRTAGHVHTTLDAFKKVWETWYFMIPAAAIVYFYWRTQRGSFTWSFQRAVNMELDRLNEERLKKPTDWCKLEPNAAMRAIAGQIEELRSQLANAKVENNSIVREKRQGLLRQISQLEERCTALDYERRVDPRVVACELPESSPTTFPSRLRRALVSKGLFQDLKSFNRLLPRVTVAVLSVALIGVAAEAGLSDVVRNEIVRLGDLQVEIAKKTVEEDWKKAETATKAPQAAERNVTDDDRRAMEHIANHFARSLAQNTSWRPFRRTNAFSRDFQRDLVRREILANVDLPEGAGKKAASYADDAAVGFKSTEQEVLGDLSRKPGTPDSHLGQKVAAQEKGYADALGARWQKVKAAALRHAAAYKEPVKVTDLHSALVDRVVATAFDSVVPSDIENEFAQIARSGLSTAAKKAASEAVEIEFKRTLMDLAGDMPFEEAMAGVRSRRIAVPTARAEEIALLLEHERMPQSADFESKVRAQRNWRSIPESLGDAREAQTIADEIAARATEGGRRSLPEEAVDALASYDDHFPSSAGGGGGVGGGGVGGHGGASRTVLSTTLERHRLPRDVESFRKASQLRVQRASSFRMLRGFSRVGGVLIGEQPENPATVLAYKDIEWQVSGRDVTLIIMHRSGSSQSFGPFDKSLVHQALAYAADGRPVAVTMTKARPLPHLKIHLHPALLDTPVGCRVTELDRFVDTFTRDTMPERSIITQRYAAQFGAYQYAWAKRLQATLGAELLRRESGIDRTIQRTISDKGILDAVQATLADARIVEGPASVFALKPEFFDKELVKKLRGCAISSKTADAFGSCIQAAAASKISQEPEEQTRLFTRPEFEPWSGVRERKFRLTEDLAFLRPPTVQTPADRLWPLDFIIQIAFTSPVIDPPKGQSADEYVDDSPIEFRAIQAKIADHVWLGIENGRLQPMFKDLRDFTVLQRLFRQILAGRLGTEFPIAKLGGLTRATGGSVPYFYTRRWNGSAMSQIQGLLIGNLADSERRRDAWIPAARSNALRCLAAIRGREGGQQLATACDFDSVAEAARPSCTGNPRDVACGWAELKGLGPGLVNIHRMEYAFGVMKDDENTRGATGCPALAPPVVAADSERRAQ